jgi:3'-phosphoadenosine 5'-phosphosulfate sulfotransferase (PAPS reductase)/FAD synthetase
MVITPKRDILMDGLRRDQMYTRAKAREEERKGRVRRGEISWEC